ncbi:MAG: peptidylprolyl isomerase [Candidatus Acidiferrales bacterium]
MLKLGRMLIQISIAAALATSLAAAQSQTAAKPQATHPPVAHHAAAAAYDHALLNPALLHARAPAEYNVKMTTTKGIVIIHVTRTWAPNGADRFYNLVAHHYFDGASFFRVISGFMVQFGLSAYPAVNHAWQNAEIKDDPKSAVTQSNHRGFITFAMTGEPNSRTTQVFINLVDNARLDASGFMPFGQVTQGMEVVDQLYSGYGEGAPQGAGPDQEQLANKGRAYVDAKFPKLDSIKTAVIVPPVHPATAPVHHAPAAAAHAPAASH